MALTATVSSKTRKEVVHLLGMYKPVFITKSPDKPNIIYSVNEKQLSLEDTFYSFAEELRRKRTEMEKTIIFCRTYNDCSYLYLYFRDVLQNEITEPIGYPDISQFRILDMFNACNTSHVKSNILSSFASPKSRLRVIVATVAFGMGIDCPNVENIIHWGPPSDCESYIQETGRAGQDGTTAYATLYYNKRDISHPYMESGIVDYCENNEYHCRRHMLFKDFGCDNSCVKPIGCKCCDICAIVCDCDLCKF